jgi:hypothetical protein
VTVCIELSENRCSEIVIDERLHYVSRLMACLPLPIRDTLAFDEPLAGNPELHRVGFYRLTCRMHGLSRLLTNGIVAARCPRCSQPAQLSRARNLICATRRLVPIVQRRRADNTPFNTPPAWLRQRGFASGARLRAASLARYTHSFRFRAHGCYLKKEDERGRTALTYSSNGQAGTNTIRSG